MAATTINPEAEIPVRANDALADALTLQAKLSLPDLLNRRNALVDAANKLVDPENEELDAATARYDAIEQAIREEPPETVDDVIAKLALVAELVREHGCPNPDDVSAILADASYILYRACDPMHPEKVCRRDAHWALMPIDNASPTITHLAQELDRRYRDEHTAMEGDDEALYEAAVAHTGPIAHQLMVTPATTLADFRAKARAVAWALSDDWEAWTDIGTFGQFGKALIRELLSEEQAPVHSNRVAEGPALLAAE